MTLEISVHKILVVEDDPDIRESLCDALTAVGYCAVAAANGREALDRLCDPTRPCLILLDLMMPVMNGDEFLAVLRGTDAIAQLPVVVVSAWPDAAAQLRAQTQGFVKKPVRLKNLLDITACYCRPCDQEGAPRASAGS